MCGSSFSNNLGAVISSSSCSMPCNGSSPFFSLGRISFDSLVLRVNLTALFAVLGHSGNSLQTCGGFYTTTTFRYTPSLSSSSTPTSTSVSASASAVVLPTGWTTVGCTQDGDARALTGSSVDLGSSATVESCLALCLKQGFVLAGLQ